MKRLLILFSMLAVFSVSTWGQENDNYSWFEQSAIYVNDDNTTTVTNKIWYDGTLSSGGTYYGELPYPAAYDDFVYSFKVISGTVSESNVSVVHNSGNSNVTITFPANSKGIIEVTGKNEIFEPGKTFTCVCYVYLNVGKRWEFNVKPFTLNDNTAWGNLTSMSTPENNHFKYYPFNYTQGNNVNAIGKSLDELTNNTNNCVTNLNDAKMLIKEAQGLKFITDQYHFGYNNGKDWPTETKQNDVDHPLITKNGQTLQDKTKDLNCYTRFICLKAGSKIIIPKEEYASYTYPRVRIKMNRDAIPHEALDLRISSNARDAVGTTFDYQHGFYDIGGSAWWGPSENKSDCLYRGEYQFQIVDKEKNFVIEIPTNTNNNNGNCWLLVYSIEVYDSKELITENNVLENNKRYQFLHTKYTNADGNIISETKPTAANYQIHYRGKAEHTKVAECTTTGTVGTKATDNNLNGDNFVNRFTNKDGSANDHVYTPVDEEYGTFRMRLGVYTHNGNYCTDYAYRTMSVGYMENKQYPYTWDFTDVNGTNGYWNSAAQGLEDNYNALQNTIDGTTDGTANYKLGKTNIPRNLWETGTTNKWENQPSEAKSGKGLRVANDASGYDVLFCGGSQLWYGDKIIPETAGLGFTPVSFDGTYNDAMIFGNTGMTSYNDVRDWWLWRITVPQVTSDDVIYVRAKKIVDNSFYNVGFVYGDANNKTTKNAFGSEGSALVTPASQVNILSGNEVVYAIPSPSSTQNVTLFFTGVEVQKIAVSRDPKTVNKYGWATESRERVIDPELTSYMTGYGIESCPVTSLDYSAKTVTLASKIGNDNILEKYVMAATSTSSQDNHAYIIHNTEQNQPIRILNGGFHLFVPDMHDYDGTNNANKTVYDFADSKMRAVLISPWTVPQKETINGDEYTNFVLTWQYARYDKDGNLVDLNDNPVETAQDYGYVGFFMVQPGGVASAGHQGYLPILTSQLNSANNFTLIYSDDETNGIDSTVKTFNTVNDNVYYNLSGQKLNGVPTKGGIYIVNGKKVVIK